jgi:peptidyl-prolyl cis-trans isomerase A (cyclophilin A)
MRRSLPWLRDLVVGVLLAAIGIGVLCGAQDIAPMQALSNPESPEVNRRAPDLFQARLQTSKGIILIEVHRDWAPHGADRFYNLARAGYYDGDRFFRVISGRWAQFGINGDPSLY